MVNYVSQPKDYWIAANAVSITRNAMGDPNRIQGSVASGAVILCYIEGINGLGYDNGHRFRTWPLSLSPTYFNSDTKKYVYVAIPRSSDVGNMAVVVFPSEKLDILGYNEGGAQIGSSDYYYIWLQGILSATDGQSPRTWQSDMDFGRKGTDEDLYDDSYSDWYTYSKVNQEVTFLKPITMAVTSFFKKLILGTSNPKEINGVAVSTTQEALVDSDTLVATPSYVHANYLRKNVEDTATERMGFLKGLWVKTQNLFGISADGDAAVRSLTVKDNSGQVPVTTASIAQDGAASLASAVCNLLRSVGFSAMDGLAGNGFRMSCDANGKATIQIDDLLVLGRMLVNSLEIREVSYIGGVYLLSPAGGKVVAVKPLYGLSSDAKMSDSWSLTAGSGYSSTIVGYRLYSLSDDGETATANYWRRGDMAFCKTFDVTQREGQQVANSQWWRIVTRTGTNSAASDVLGDGKGYHWIDVSNIPYVDLYDGSAHLIRQNAPGMEGYDDDTSVNTVPRPSDRCVCLGSMSEQTRQGAVQIKAVGEQNDSTSASIDIYDGINDFAPLSNFEVHHFGRDMVRMSARRFEWSTGGGSTQRPSVYMGTWVGSTSTPYPSTNPVSYRGYEWDYNGSRWLCIINDENGTQEPPGTTEAYWSKSKGEQGVPGPAGPTGATGPTGPAGPAGYSVIADPAVLTLSESLSAADSFSLPQYVTFYVIGNSSVTVSDVAVHARQGVTVDRYDSSTVRISAVNSGATRGYIDVDVTLSNGTTILVDVPVIINRQGTIKTTIEGDVETTVGNKVTTEINSRGLITATEANSLFVKSAELNVSQLNQTIDGIQTGMSEMRQTVDSISLGVEDGVMAGDNLIPGSLVELTSSRGYFRYLPVGSLPPGDYTLSASGFVDSQAYTQGCRLEVFFYIDDSTSHQWKEIQSMVMIDTKRTVFSRQITIPSPSGSYANGSPMYVCLNLQVNDSNERAGTATVDWVKLEAGGSMTHWCPSSEDADYRDYVANHLAVDAVLPAGALASEVRDSTFGRVLYLQANNLLANAPMFVPEQLPASVLGGSFFVYAVVKQVAAGYLYLYSSSTNLMLSSLDDVYGDSSRGGYIASNGWKVIWKQYDVSAQGIVTVGGANVGVDALFSGSWKLLPSSGQWLVYAVGATIGRKPGLREIAGDTMKYGLRRTGIDIERGLITAQTDNFQVINSAGQKTFGIDSDGNLYSLGNASFGGTIRARNLYRMLMVCWGYYVANDSSNEEYAEEPSGETWYWVEDHTQIEEPYDELFVDNEYVSLSEIIERTEGQISAPAYPFVQTTGPADIILVRDYSRDSQGAIVPLPRPADFAGKLIEVCNRAQNSVAAYCCDNSYAFLIGSPTATAAPTVTISPNTSKYFISIPGSATYKWLTI